MRSFSWYPFILSITTSLVLLACSESQDIQEPGHPDPDPLTVLSVEQGDIACYIDLREVDGKRVSMKGSFEICDERWVGKRVLIRTDRVNVQSPKCEGDPECTLTEEEEIIVELDEF